VHPDALHLSVSAYGKDFLVDSGRFWYMRDQWTDFAHSSRSHNVILIDACDQEPKPKKAEKPLPETHWAITDAFDYARATHDQFENLKGTAVHTRIVVFLRGTGWVVVDRIATDRPRALTPMWRFRPERKVEIAENGALKTVDAKGANLSITPVGPVAWKAELVRGQEQPHLQGWHSDVSTEWEPSPCAVYSGRIEDDTVFGWVILPVKDGRIESTGEPVFEVDEGKVVVRLTTFGGEAYELSIPLNEGAPTLGPR
ncbi:MAG: heparinase II/III domain-containing protein, partial [Verrucomicrobiota bacterium]